MCTVFNTIHHEIHSNTHVAVVKKINYSITQTKTFNERVMSTTQNFFIKKAVLLVAICMCLIALFIAAIDGVNLFYIFYGASIPKLLVLDDKWQTHMTIFSTAFGTLLDEYEQKGDEAFNRMTETCGKTLVLMGAAVAMYILFTTTIEDSNTRFYLSALELCMWPMFNLIVAITTANFIYQVINYAYDG